MLVWALGCWGPCRSWSSSSSCEVLGVRVVLVCCFHLLLLLLSCLRCCLENGPAVNNEARLLPFFEAGVDMLQVHPTHLSMP